MIDMIEIIERASMVDCKPRTAPVDTSLKFSGDTGDPVSDPTHYHNLVGALQYLTFTLLDIFYAVQQVCLHMNDLREPHMDVLKCILCYLSSGFWSSSSSIIHIRACGLL
jgi:hypothetical protein